MSVEVKEDSIEPAAVRAELKAWETAFKEQHGRKAGREDIKKDATIQAKYKLYNALTSRASRPKATSTPSKSIKHARIEKPAKGTPKRTPSKKHSTLQAPVLSPVQEAEPTPAFIRNALGPTPYRDGQVLSIFDIAIENTPLKGDSPSKTNSTALIAGTPSKSAATASEASGHSRTPQSLSKRYFLDAFAGTPLKRKRDDNDIETTSSSKRKFATPSFLRRSALLAPIAEDNAEAASSSSSLPPPFRKRGLVRSLSSIIQGLKKQEEKRMDDEWDVMNEIEEEEANEGPLKKLPVKVQVQDSQDVEMPLGPDQAAESSESEEEHRNTGRKPWKKQGLKRQTRRAKMKPVMHKPQKAEADEASEEEEIAPETQPQYDLEDADELGQDFEDAQDSASDTEKKAKRKAKQKPASSSKVESKEGEKEEPRKKGRKVDPLAHANFRALKIKNKNSKASGRRGKFGRR
ncbi:hypothetical protein AC579_8239 [Pseudocercospora musae]|uniref:DNA replication regulator SLD2 n=1 Tax=Pseudocercospora musae TaxID=113226 RepID=A0A139IW14_9PEZI|nr:hypothetical protein AC579_8239 [Pseudocercospora musae]